MNLRRASSLALAAGIAAPGAALIGIAQTTPAAAAGGCTAHPPEGEPADPPGGSYISFSYELCEPGQVSRLCLQRSEHGDGGWSNAEYPDGSPACGDEAGTADGRGAAPCQTGAFYYRTALTGPGNFKLNSEPAKITGFKADGAFTCAELVE